MSFQYTSFNMNLRISDIVIMAYIYRFGDKQINAELSDNTRFSTT